LLTFVFSWTLWIGTALSGQAFTEFPAVVLYTLGGFGPSVVGVWMIYREPDRASRRDLWQRLTGVSRISGPWYAAIIVIFPLIFGVAYGINALIGSAAPAMEGFAQVRLHPAALVGILIGGLVGGPLSEELGWRGFAQDKVQARWPGWKANLLLAAVWWAWHLPLFFIEGTTQARIGLGTAGFWLFLANIVPLTFIMAATYNANRRSVLSAVLLHWLFNLTVTLVFPLPIVYNTIAVILCTVAASILYARTHSGSTESR